VGKYSEASHYFYRGLKEQPNSTYGRLGLAMALVKRENYQDAMDEYRKVLSRDKKNADALLGIGICMYELGRLSEAEHFLDQSLESRANNPLAYDALGDLYFKKKQYAEAIASYRMAIVQKEDLANAHLGLGQCLEAVGHLTEAEEALQQALYHAPHNPVVLYRLGQVHELLNNTARALAYYEMAMENVAGNIELENTIRGALRSLSEAEQD